MNYEQQLVSLLQAQQQHATQVWFGYMVLGVAGLLINGFVIYMFYARLRDMADELRKLRVAFEFSSDRSAQACKRPPDRGRTNQQDRAAFGL